MNASMAVVIPAHDEESVIERCLRFAADLDPGEAEVVVVANGCSDRTAIRAASVPGVRVVELGSASKTDALNAGDAMTTTFPRIYLDADIAVDADALRRMRDTLDNSSPRICAPAVHFRTEGRPWAVRAFYRVYTRLPYVSDGLVGLGIYGISATGRLRFGEFPRLTNDDMFVQRLFSRGERTVLAGDSFTVETPRSLEALVAVRTRAAFGNTELARSGSPEHASSSRDTARALLRLVAGKPLMLPEALVYVGVTVLAVRRARRQANGQWQRDHTTR